MNRYLRIWVPVSLAAHLLFYFLLRMIPAFPAVPAATSPISIVMLAPLTVANEKHLNKPVVKPLPLTPISPQRSAPLQRTVAPATQLAAGTQRLPAQDIRLPNHGGYHPDLLPGALPKLNPGPVPNRNEGLADRPEIHDGGTNPLPFAHPQRGGIGRPGNGGSLGTAAAMLPGTSLPTSAGGSAGATGGHASAFPGNGPLGIGDLPAMGGSALTAPHGPGSLQLERPGPLGGAGRGSGGIMAAGPSPPGHWGTTMSGPIGAAIGLQPGAAPGDGVPNGGGAHGNAGYPFGGLIAAAGLPDSSAPAGSPRRTSGDTDHPGTGGGPGSSFSGQGPRLGLPSYAASAINGPNPTYPHVAITENLHGTVKMQVFLNKHAEVVRVDFLPDGRSMSDILDNAAKNAAKKWHFRTRMRNGIPTASSVYMEATFVLGQPPQLKEVP